MHALEWLLRLSRIPRIHGLVPSPVTHLFALKRRGPKVLSLGHKFGTKKCLKQRLPYCKRKIQCSGNRNCVTVNRTPFLPPSRLSEWRKLRGLAMRRIAPAASAARPPRDTPAILTKPRASTWRPGGRTSSSDSASRARSAPRWEECGDG